MEFVYLGLLITTCIVFVLSYTRILKSRHDELKRQVAILDDLMQYVDSLKSEDEGLLDELDKMKKLTDSFSAKGDLKDKNQ